MKKNLPNFVRLSMIIGLFCLCLSLSGTVHADCRWCGTCNYEVVVTHINGKRVDKVFRVGNFKGKGCANLKNNARREARDACNRCMKAHWNNRTGSYVPQDCTESKNVFGYDVKNLQEEIEKKARSLVEPYDCNGDTAEINLSIFRYVHGDTGCGPNLDKTLREKIVDGYLVKGKCPPRIKLDAPELVSPADNTTFYHGRPRTTILVWKPVPGAVRYTAEIDCFHCCTSGKWCTEVGKSYKIQKKLTDTRYTFDFVGAQPGRWRVWAVDKYGKIGHRSEWRKFSYTR